MNSEQKWVGWAGNDLGSGRVDPSQIDPISDFLGDQSSSGWAYLWFTPSAHLTGQDDLSFPFLKEKKTKTQSLPLSLLSFLFSLTLVLMLTGFYSINTLSSL